MKLVLFDVDGTLVDSQHMICAAMTQAYQAQGLVSPEPAAVRAIIGLSLPNAIRQLSGDADHPIDELTAGYKEAFFELRAAGAVATPLFPGAREAIDRLRQRPDIMLGIATGKSRRGVAAMLEQHDLKDVFVTIQTADTSPSKPHPGMVLEAMNDCGVAAGNTVVVGDTVFDIQMARAAAAGAIGVAWGYHPVDDLHGAGADAVVEDFAALDGAFTRLWPTTSLDKETALDKEAAGTVSVDHA